MLLITGITGHTGKYFFEELIKHNYSGKIRCVVRKSSDVEFLKKGNLDIELAYGDLNDIEFLNSSIVGIEEIVHIYNIHHSEIILQAALECGVRKIVLVHTTGIYSKFKNASFEYKNIERNIGEILKQSNSQIEVVILRPSMIYGDICDKNISKFIKLVDRFKIIPVISGGKSLIQPVNARDLGKAYYQVLTTVEGQKSFDLTGDRPIEIKEVLDLIATNLDKKIYYLNIPLSIGVLAARFLKLLTLSKIDYIEKVQRMGENRSYSHKEAEAAFNFSPIKIEDGISIEVRQYLKKERR